MFSYDFGDGSDATKPAEGASSVTHQYGMPGEYTVTAIFTDVPGVAKVCLSNSLAGMVVSRRRLLPTFRLCHGRLYIVIHCNFDYKSVM